MEKYKSVLIPNVEKSNDSSLYLQETKEAQSSDDKFDDLQIIKTIDISMSRNSSESLEDGVEIDPKMLIMKELNITPLV